MKIPARVVQSTITWIFLFLVVVTLGCENPISLLQSVSRATHALTVADPAVAQDDAASAEDDSKNKAAENLVKGWDKPDVTLFITGRLHGYIEPCGCTGLSNQKGGLLRRHTCQKMLQAKGFEPISIDLGNQIRRVGQQATIKYKTACRSIAKVMKYDAIGVGIDDMRISGADMVLAIEESKPADSTPFTSGSMMVYEDDSFTRPFQIVQRNGKKIGVLSVIGDEHVKKAKEIGISDDYSLKMPETAVREALRNPAYAKCDVRVLLMQSAPEKCKAMAAKYPYFDLVVTGGGAGDPTLEATAIASSNGHTTQMIQCGVKGMYCGVVGIDFADAKKKIRYQRVALDASFKDSKPVKDVFLAYQNELKTLWLGGLLDDIKPRLHPSGHQFVGSDACYDCHEEEFDIWKEGHEGDGGPHARATADLTDPGERTWVKRNFDPECVSCHVTGWNPQNYYPYETGYRDLKKDHVLHGNGCENCHGPGSAHVAAENKAGADEALLKKLRDEMVVTVEEAKKRMCFECHDLDNSPDYAEAEDGWEKYWPTIKHGDND